MGDFQVSIHCCMEKENPQMTSAQGILKHSGYLLTSVVFNDDGRQILKCVHITMCPGNGGDYRTKNKQAQKRKSARISAVIT